MTQATTPTGTIYPFAERIRSATVSTTDTTIWNIPAGTIIMDVYCKVITAGVGETTSYITVGDSDDPDGFIAGFDPTSVAGTMIGDDPTERGAYLYDSTKKTLCGKDYNSAGTMVVDCEVSGNTTEPIFDVFIMGYRYAV